MKKSSNPFLKISILISVHLLLLLLLKYYQNGLTVSDFRFGLFGNILNITTSLLIILGIALHVILKLERSGAVYKIFLSASYLMIIPLAILLFILIFKINITDDYLFGFARKKFLFGLLFAGSFLTQLFLLTIVWGYIFKSELMIFVRSIIQITALVIAAILLTFLYNILFPHKNEQSIKNNSYDVGIVLGAAVWSDNQPSPIFEARIQKANDLFHKKIIKKIQLTGGNAPGEISEAEAAANLLNHYGVNDSDLLIEEKTSTTSEQIRFIKRAEALGTEESRVLIISDRFHLVRILEMCKFYNVHADVIPSEYKMSFGQQLFYSFRDSIGLLLFWIFAI